MRVLNVNALLDAASGGGTAERTLQLSRAFAAAGNDTTVLTLDIGLDTARTQALGAARLVALPCLQRRFLVPRPDRAHLDALVREADVVHITGHWTPLNALAWRAARRAGTPHVVCPAGALPVYGRSRVLKRAFNAAEWTYPLLIKSTDGGETWSDVFSVALTGADCPDGIKNFISDETLEILYEGTEIPDREGLLFTTPYFNSDISLDAWGNPHLATSVHCWGPGLDPGYWFTLEGSIGIIDIYSIDDDNTNWQAALMGMVRTMDHDFPVTGQDPLPEYNWVQIASDADGKYMFVAWLATRIEEVVTTLHRIFLPAASTWSTTW